MDLLATFYKLTVNVRNGMNSFYLYAKLKIPQIINNVVSLKSNNIGVFHFSGHKEFGFNVPSLCIYRVINTIAALFFVGIDWSFN